MHFASHLRSERLGEFTIGTRAAPLGVAGARAGARPLPPRHGARERRAGRRRARAVDRVVRPRSALEQHVDERAREGDLPEGQRGAEVRRAEQRGDERHRRRTTPSSDERWLAGSRARRLTLEGRHQRGHVGAGVLRRPASARPRAGRRAARRPALAVLGDEVGQRARRAGRRRRRAARSSALAMRVERRDAASSIARDRRDRRDGHHRRCRASPSERSAACRSRRARSATSPRSALVTTSTSGISMIPDFRNCRTSPEPGCTITATVSATSATSVSRLADADGLDHDDVEGGRQRLRRGARRRREPAEAPARGRGADEDARGRPGRRRSARGRRAARRPSAATTGRRRGPRRCARRRASARTSSPSSVDLPAPGGPVTPTTWPGASPPSAAGETSRSSVGDLPRAAPPSALDEVEHGGRGARGRRRAAARRARRRPRSRSTGAAAAPWRSGHQRHDVAHDLREVEVLGRVDRRDAGRAQRLRRRPRG